MTAKLIKWALGFLFDTLLGQIVAAVLGLTLMFSIWLWQHDNKIEARATTTLTNKLNSSAETLTNEALKSRAPAALPGAAERLRKGSCADCDG